LFTGIGGFDLAATRVGWEIKWQVEIDPFCWKVLEKHWPHVRRYEDVRTVGAELEHVDVLCGGWPCQPVSSAARGRNKRGADPRFLGPEVCRVVSLKRPRWFLGENVTHLDGPELEQMVSTLESLGYEIAPPLEIPACAFGLDHWRPRLWILGHADSDRQSGRTIYAEASRLSQCGCDDAGSLGAAHGVSGRVDRRRMAALGNAIVPQIAEWIFRQIQAAEDTQRAVSA
jgi:DNA (cytosine-5)-methyltransferase 1